MKLEQSPLGKQVEWLTDWIFLFDFRFSILDFRFSIFDFRFFQWLSIFDFDFRFSSSIFDFDFDFDCGIHFRFSISIFDLDFDFRSWFSIKENVFVFWSTSFLVTDNHSLKFFNIFNKICSQSHLCNSRGSGKYSWF